MPVMDSEFSTGTNALKPIVKHPIVLDAISFKCDL